VHKGVANCLPNLISRKLQSAVTHEGNRKRVDKFQSLKAALAGNLPATCSLLVASGGPKAGCGV
jgi:hypothetical protein